ncbi:MAG TPA: DNA-protecting protein DprA [Candidatus Magasanikbacteria bacterium]|nr:MAG: DNA protecting protein DprA [Candidatus Magasanikbacteria bacterium RIFOXYC2_FULL_39_8]HAT03692.1 DNA-protecting protein DprA [Candidatus Magasanikbacteria bacterium]
MKKEILLSYFPKITIKRYRELLGIFSSLEEAWDAEFDELKKMRWDDNLIHEFLTWREKVDEEKIQTILDHEGIHCITLDMEEYPELLKHIYDPPFCIFARGTLKNNFNLAVVGTRKYTPYGKQATEELIAELAPKGITIVSGLAFGIDSIAHEATLLHNGTTVAVLGSGINRHHIYPRAHQELSKKIITHGGSIISEYPPGTLPNSFTFPRRNRIIAGMSLGTLVIEAPEKSGALITAECAMENNREVFAIPHNITSRTATGPNNLIKTGAKCVTKAQDIIDTLNLQDIKEYVTNKEVLPDSPTEAQILPHLSREPIHIDELIKKSNLNSQTVNSALVLMEMKGKIRNLGGMMYVLAR